MQTISINRVLRGKILDIGGGGDGIIGRVYGEQVVAIDNCQEELDETPDGFEKVFMDASELTFQNESFDHVTAFYSFLFIRRDLYDAVLAEAVRVLRPGGKLHIWDCCVTTAYPEPFFTELDVDANGTRLHPAYGVVKENAEQNAATFTTLCQKYGLRLTDARIGKENFYLQFEVPANQ